MLRTMGLTIAMLLVAGCGKAVELANQTRTVAAPREQVFARMFGDDSAFAGLPLVTNGGSTRLYELVVEKKDPLWAQIAPKERPEAYKVKFAVAMEIPREAHMIYSVDDGALSTGLKFTFDELAPDRTRVAFTLDELTGHDTAGLAVNASKLREIARDALKKLDDFDEAKDAA
ncbi:hypothetical protein [Sphingopyxis panaciterrae]